MSGRANKRDTEIRAALESIGGELVAIRTVVPLAQLRVRQAKERTGLDDLLSPAIDEMEEVSKAVAVIGEQVRAALAKLEKV